MGSRFDRIRPGTYELAALERLEKSPLIYNGRNVVTTLVTSFLDGSSLFLQVTRPTIKARMSLNLSKILPLTSELAALERRKINKLCCDHSSAFIFDWIFFILAGNKETYKISNGFVIQRDSTSDL